jgi:hypothetical protein
MWKALRAVVPGKVPEHRVFSPCIDIEEEEALALWLEQWHREISECTESGGCGCCVWILSIRASSNALAALPRTPNLGVAYAQYRLVSR